MNPTIAGTVNADGSIRNGSGFSVTRTGTGQYTLRLPPSFRVLSCTATMGRGGSGGTDLLPGAANTYTVYTYITTTGALENDLWAFTAVGLPTLT